ncbi:hypothetical protein [Pseudomonas rubra]|uniref:Uncharacterized protein n=1 Tax=Pseudomonas rubra TaxID=2942627 RepID=A0ABT5PEF1_9PSED|nr:hypothetical protein [Pseudomonas rubra]MDD1016691.1 hypothetical protein [Pseudomonas rubra]MDD1040922.1 hypothetical protein [Pseudomonas rubra]MDD1157548.1 hypothetical protein [Pseudomonas rubra]
MSPHPARPYTSSAGQIIISSSEHCSIGCFINQYVESRGLQSDAGFSNEVTAALRDFFCAAPVKMFELNAWLDNRLGLKALHPDYLCIIDEFGDFPVRMNPPSRLQEQRSKP